MGRCKDFVFDNPLSSEEGSAMARVARVEAFAADEIATISRHESCGATLFLDGN